MRTRLIAGRGQEAVLSHLIDIEAPHSKAASGRLDAVHREDDCEVSERTRRLFSAEAQPMSRPSSRVLGMT